MCEFDILSSATTQAIPPCDPDTEDDELDSVLPPVDLQQATDCNCFNLQTNPACLVNIHTHRMLKDEEVEPGDISAVNGETEPGAGDVDEMEEIQQLTEILNIDDNSLKMSTTGMAILQLMLCIPRSLLWLDLGKKEDIKVRLAICMWRRSANKELVFEVEHEPDNVRDTNALKFMVFQNETWHIIGYCGLNKIPKLKRALHRNEVHSISLDSLKRTIICIQREKIIIQCIISNC